MFLWILFDSSLWSITLKEQEFKALTLTGHDNTIHSLLSTLHEKRNEINSSLPTEEHFPDR